MLRLLRSSALAALLLGPLSSLPGGAQPFAFSGNIRDQLGDPVVNADVELRPLLSNYERNDRLLAHSGPPPPVSMGSTDARGRYEVRAPRTGVWRLVVKAPGRVPMQYFPLAAVRSMELPPVTVLPDDSSVLEVTSPDRTPIAEALVYAQPSSELVWTGVAVDGWRPASRFRWTDASGRVRLPRAAGELLDLTVVPAGRAETISASAIEHGRIVLPVVRPRLVQIRVTDPSGLARPDVLIGIGDIAWPVARTDSDGRSLIALGHDHALRLFLIGPGGSLARARLASERLGPDAGEEIILSLEPPTTVAGRVVDATDGQAVEGTLVWPGHDPGRFTLTDADGGYSMQVAGESRFWLQAEAAARISRLRWVQPLRGGPVRADMHLPQAESIQGRIFGLGSAPQERAEILAKSTTENRDGSFRMDRYAARARSDSRGRFAIQGLDPTVPYDISVIQPGYETWRFRAHHPAHQGRLRVRLTPARGGSGRVLDTGGRAIAGATVRARRSMPGDRERRTQQPVAAERADPEEEEERFTSPTDSEGRFHVAHLPGEIVDLSVTKEGYASATLRGLEIPAGKEAFDLGTIRLKRAVVLEGLVWNQDGQGLGGASIWLRHELLPRSVLVETVRELVPTTASGGDGRFSIDGLAAGRRISLVVRREGYQTSVEEVTLRDPQAPLEVLLRKAGRIQGVVVDVDGSPVPGAGVSLRPAEPEPGVVAPGVEDDGGLYRYVEADREGRFELEGLYPGAIVLEVFEEGFQPSDPMSLGLDEGEIVEGLRVVLQPGAVVEGRITSRTGDPVAGARVTVGLPTAISDRDGFFHVEGVLTGRQIVEALHYELGRHRRTVEVTPGVTIVDLTMPEGHSISGWTVDDRGDAVESVVVTLRPETGGAFRSYDTASDAEGHFELEAVQVGVYRLLARKTGYVPAAPLGNVEVSEAAVEELKITLRPGISLVGEISGLDLNELSLVTVDASSRDRPSLAGKVHADARYEIHDLAPGVWSVRARLLGDDRQAEAMVYVDDSEAEIRRDLDFASGLDLSGRVSFEGAALPGALVTVVGRHHEQRRTARTEADGRFRIGNLEQGSYQLTASHPRLHVVHNEEIALFEDLDLEVRINAVPLRGSVVDAATGEGVHDALVVLGQLSESPGQEPVSRTTVATDTSGRFELAHVASGLYQLTVRCDGYSALHDVLDLRNPAPPPELRLELRPTQGVDVVPRLASGAPPPWVHVRVTDGSGRTVVAESRSVHGGVARFEVVPAGEWLLAIAAPGGAPVHGTVSVPGPPIEVAFPEAGALVVQVPDLAESRSRGVVRISTPGGAPLIALDGESGDLTGAWELRAGRVVVLGVPAGTWLVEATGSDGSIWRGVTTVAVGTETPMVLR